MSTEVENLGQLESQARAALEAAQSVQALTEERARFLGRKGSVSGLLRGIGELDPAERSRVGQAVNASKQRIEEWFQARRRVLEAADQARDIGRPVAAPPGACRVNPGLARSVRPRTHHVVSGPPPLQAVGS